MLAGNLKLRTFRTLAIIVGILVLLGLVALCAAPFFLDEKESEVATAPQVEVPPPVVEAPAAAAPAADAAPGVTPCDPVVLGRKGRALGGDKVKDADPALPCKANLYQDAGSAVMNRAKVDLDRDEKWDEKWTIDADAVSKQVAPADDEVYTVTYHWTGTGWAAEGAASPPPPAGAAEALPVDPARPWDAVVLGWKGRPLGSDKIKDATKGQSYKVNLYQDPGATVVNRAKVDIDRDDRWDETWAFEGDAVTREVAPADDEAYTETWTWTPEGWKRA